VALGARFAKWGLGLFIFGVFKVESRATTGHAAALPSPAMNCLRRIGHLPGWSGRSLSRWRFQGNGVAEATGVF
jgi:hypothetical protein